MAIKKNINVELIYFNDIAKNNDELKVIFTNLPEEMIYNLELKDAYCTVRIKSVSKETINILLDIYTDSTKNCLVKTESYSFSPDLTSNNTPNFYTQSYDYIKTFDKYKNAIDC